MKHTATQRYDHGSAAVLPVVHGLLGFNLLLGDLSLSLIKVTKVSGEKWAESRNSPILSVFQQS